VIRWYLLISNGWTSGPSLHPLPKVVTKAPIIYIMSTKVEMPLPDRLLLPDVI
jgi:hypothetical protein